MLLFFKEGRVDGQFWIIGINSSIRSKKFLYDIQKLKIVVFMA